MLLLACALAGPVRADSVQYAYDAVGRLSAVIDPVNGSAVYQYDAVGNILSVKRNPGSTLVVAQVTPGRAAPGALVTIAGTALGTLSTTQVSFNGTAAAPTIVSATQITVAVPQGATIGPVSVTTAGGTASTAAAFQVVTQSSPTLSSFSPQVASQGTAVTLSGSGFDPVLTNNKVFINNRAAAVTAASATALTVTVPSVSSGLVTAETPNGSATSAVPLAVAPLPYTASQVNGVTQGTLGGTVNASAGAGQVALALFDATAGQRVALQVAASSFSGGALALYGPDGAQVKQTDLTTGSFSGGTNLGQSGTYTLAAIPSDTSSGMATINLLNATSVTSAIAANGTSVPLTTTAPGQNMRLTFSGTAGQRVSLQTEADSAMSANCITLTILQPDGTTQLYQNGCANSSFSDVFALPVAGTYTILYDPSDAATGQATFTLYNVPPDATATIAANATAVPLTTTAPGQNMRLTFSGTAGQRVSLRTVTDSAMSANCITLTILQPDGTTQLYQNGCANSSFSGAVALPVTGTYTILYDPSDAATGQATFTLYNVPPDATATIAANATAVPLTTTAPGQNMRLTFSGTAGQRVSLRTVTDNAMSADCATLTILRPNGTTQLYQNGCANSSFSDVLALPVAGTYTIQFMPGGLNTGQATFTLYNVPADASATITPGGGTVAITVVQPGQNGKLTFSANSGQRVNLLTQLDSSLSAGCINVALVQPNGTTRLYNQLICSQSDISGPLPTPAAVSSTVPTLPASGTYSILLNPQDTTTGTANLTLYNVPPDAMAAVSIGGAAANATTTVPGQAIRVTFSGTAKQRATIKVTAGNSQNNGCSQATTLRPDGKTIVRGELTCGTAYSSGSLTLPVSGTYTFVFAPNGTATGTYSVSVSTP